MPTLKKTPEGEDVWGREIRELAEYMIQVSDKLAPIITGTLGVKVEQLTPGARFAEDLAADSLDRIEILSKVEAEFGLDVSDEDAETLTTVGQAFLFLLWQNPSRPAWSRERLAVFWPDSIPAPSEIKRSGVSKARELGNLVGTLDARKSEIEEKEREGNMATKPRKYYEEESFYLVRLIDKCDNEGDMRLKIVDQATYSWIKSLEASPPIPLPVNDQHYSNTGDHLNAGFEASWHEDELPQIARALEAPAINLDANNICDEFSTSEYAAIKVNGWLKTLKQKGVKGLTAVFEGTYNETTESNNDENDPDNDESAEE